MAKEKKPKKPKNPDKPIPLDDEDNPSLNKVGGKLCLRVFEDFFVETELPKWKRFDEQKNEFMKSLELSEYDLDSKSVVDNRIGQKAPKDAERLKERYEVIRKMREIVKDDRWNIRQKHEQEVDESVRKCAIHMGFKPTTLRGKLSRWLDRFRKKPQFTPVEIAFEDLKDNMVITSSDELMQAKSILDDVIARFKRAGQYGKAAEAERFVPQLSHELAIANIGFTKFVTESQMIDFVKKSERGVMVNFLRYYEGQIPDEVIRKKEEADAKMVFDNYVVAYYCDMVKKAVADADKKKEEKKDLATVKRRDPILFGMVKQTRKLYYICDWVTPDDDLTLDKLEKVLGEKAKTLFSLNATEQSNIAAFEDMGNSGEANVLRNVQANAAQSSAIVFNQPVATTYYSIADTDMYTDSTSVNRMRRG